ncbi:unnamed protein product [Rotaria sp. Silwood1]|nr:unnamed protein product [Rotaria sp. Silwood1]
MEQLKNFGPNDAQNGTLAQMFRNAGINDVHTYVGDVRQEYIDLNDSSIAMSNNDDYNSVNNSQIRSNQSNRIGNFLNNSQQGIDKRSNGKSGLNNVKQIYQMYKSLDKNDLFTEHELKLIDEFRNRFHSLAKSIITLYEVDFKFDRSVLTRMCQECQELTHKIISKHLTQKSHARIDYVFNYVSNIDFLEYSFNPNSTINRAIIKEIIEDMHTLMDAGFL